MNRDKRQIFLTLGNIAKRQEYLEDWNSEENFFSNFISSCALFKMACPDYYVFFSLLIDCAPFHPVKKFVDLRVEEVSFFLCNNPVTIYLTWPHVKCVSSFFSFIVVKYVSFSHSYFLQDIYLQTGKGYK